LKANTRELLDPVGRERLVPISVPLAAAPLRKSPIVFPFRWNITVAMSVIVVG
jgi:hypothetical protein